MSTGRSLFNIPLPELQVDFSALLLSASGQVLQQALLDTVRRSDISVLDKEAHEYVPEDTLKKLAGRGLRAELVFVLPSLLSANPRLLGYYRLLLGFSQKAFYTRQSGLSLRMEEKGELSPRVAEHLPELCKALNRSAAYLLSELPVESVTREHLEQLTLLTFGPQLRGSHNVAIGIYAVREVFQVIRNIVGPHATAVEEQLISLTDATGRQIQIRFSSDPDIEVVSVAQAPRTDVPLLAIEVKGGTDFSNVHNRLGEAEKSQLKAKSRGFTDLWTIVNVEGLSDAARRAASPTTTAFFDLRDLRAREGPAYEDFRERLLQKLRLPER